MRAYILWSSLGGQWKTNFAEFLGILAWGLEMTAICGAHRLHCGVDLEERRTAGYPVLPLHVLRLWILWDHMGR